MSLLKVLKLCKWFFVEEKYSIKVNKLNYIVIDVGFFSVSIKCVFVEVEGIFEEEFLGDFVKI